MQVRSQQINPYQIPTSKMGKSPAVSFQSRPVPSLPNHISWDQAAPSVPNVQVLNPSNINTQPKRRRKIFEHNREKSRSKSKKVTFEASHEKLPQPQKIMRKVKSNTSFNTPSFCQEQQLQQRIKDLNQQIAEHRSSRTQLSGTQRHQPKQGNSSEPNKVKQLLTQSNDMIPKQQHPINSKLPSYEQTLQANSNSTSKASLLFQSRLQESNLKMSRMIDLAAKNESRLKTKEDELQKINTELIHKEYELMRNKEEKKKRDLELIRIKRIEDLQNKNLELYQSIEKQSFRGFQNLEENSQAMVENAVWEDEQDPASSKFTYNQESTIKYHEPPLNSSQQDATLGEILSPLALNDYHY